MERQLDLTGWGPILDHGVGFNFDCWHHYLYTGDLEALREPYPRLLRFAQYLAGPGRAPTACCRWKTSAFPRSGWTMSPTSDSATSSAPSTSMRPRRCEHALAPLCTAFGDPARPRPPSNSAGDLQAAAVARFWSPERGLFINNLPWLAEEKATAHLRPLAGHGHPVRPVPGRPNWRRAAGALVDCPPEMGFSYPANAGWRLWALAKAGRADVIVADLRRALGDDGLGAGRTTRCRRIGRSGPTPAQQWSHCPVVPLYIAYHGLMGLKPLSPGFTRYELRPQLADLKRLELTAHTVRGPITLQAQGVLGDREVTIDLPPQAQGEIVLPQGEAVELARAAAGRPRRPQSLPLAAWRQNHLTTATGLIHKLAFEPDGTQGRASPATICSPLG